MIGRRSGFLLGAGHFSGAFPVKLQEGNKASLVPLQGTKIFFPIQIRHPFESIFRTSRTCWGPLERLVPKKRVTSLSNYISMNAPLHGTEKRSFHHISSWFLKLLCQWPFQAFQPLVGFFGLDPISSIGSSAPKLHQARFRTLWAANHWQAPRGLGGRWFRTPGWGGHGEDPTKDGGCGEVAIPETPKLGNFAFEEGKWDPLF